MQSACNRDFEASEDLVLESQWDDGVSADDDASECWTQPWDLPAKVNCTGHSNTSSVGLRDVTAAACKNTPTEHSSAKASLISTMTLNDNKAGMQGLDKEHINQIIYEASKGSKYYENEKRKDMQIQDRIARQKEELDSLTHQQKALALAKADKLLERLEKRRDLTHTIVHVDMDAFFAAVEMLDRPELRELPMAVGSKYMLSTSNYVARRYGVRAAMPGFIGQKLCPELIIITPNFEKYSAMSERVRAVFAEYDPNYSTMSLDEAYLDITEHLERRCFSSDMERTFPGYSRPELICRCTPNSDSLSQECAVGMKCTSCMKPVEKPTLETFGVSAEEAVREMRFRIYQDTCLTASAGIAANTMIAKVCSDRNKPNGQFAVHTSAEAILSFMHDLPIRKICGIGKVTEKMLAALGIETCFQLYERRDILYYLYSQSSFEHFMQIYLGIGSTHVERDGERKSMSVERTFGKLSDPSDLYDKCLSLSESLANDLHDERLVGKTVTLKIKLVSFEVRTRAQTIAQHTNDAHQINLVASRLLHTEIDSMAPKSLELRLMGVRMSQLRQEDSGTIVSMLRRPCSDNRSMSLLSSCDASAEDDHSLPSFASFELTGQLSKRSQTELLEDSECSSEAAVARCPVCGKSLQLVDGNEVLVNRHVDECLNEAAVSELLASEKWTSSVNKLKKVETDNKSVAKRQKTESSVHTLDRYFKKPT